MQTQMLSDAKPVSCPCCNKTRPATPGVYFCSNCGAEFSVMA